jgi:hypothetical protein
MDSSLQVLGPFIPDYQGKHRRYKGFTEIEFHTTNGIQVHISVNNEVNKASIRVMGNGWQSNFSFNASEINEELVHMIRWAADQLPIDKYEWDRAKAATEMKRRPMDGGKKSKRKHKKRSKY